MRTFSRTQWDEAQTLWDEGQFSDEWKPIRHKAAMRGMLYPPEGTRWDSWDDDAPSQRAILIRAIRETPTMLGEAIARCKSWHDVIAYIMARHTEWREGLNERDREIARRRAEDRPAEAAMDLKLIIQRIADS